LAPSSGNLRIGIIRLKRRGPVLALSGHANGVCRMSAIGDKADIALQDRHVR